MTPFRTGGRDAGPARDPGLDAPLLAILLAERRPHTPAELAERTGLPVRTVQRALGKLVREREVRRAGGGTFAAAARPGRR